MNCFESDNIDTVNTCLNKKTSNGSQVGFNKT